MRQRALPSSRADAAGAGFFTPPLPRIFAHRGLACGVPENTLPAFIHALAAGATHLETDVQVSSDGVAVLSHDADLKRVAGRDVRIDQLTMAELRGVDLGDGTGFVSLEEALDVLPDALFNIDVKVPGAAAALVKAVMNKRATDRVLVTSFSAGNRLAAVADLIGVATSGSVPQVLLGALGGRFGIRPLVRAATRDIDALQLPERYRNVRLVTRRSVAALHRAGIEVHVWTVNQPDVMRRLLELGVDGIITDRCDLAREVVDSRS